MPTCCVQFYCCHCTYVIQDNEIIFIVIVIVIVIVSNQWGTASLCNDDSHWLGASLESALVVYLMVVTRYVYAYRDTRDTIINGHNCPDI